MRIDDWIVYSAVGAIVWFFVSMRNNQKEQIRKLESQVDSINSERLVAIKNQAIAENGSHSAKSALASAIEQRDRSEQFSREVLSSIRKESALLPSVVSLLKEVESQIDFSQSRYLRTKSRPAVKAAEALDEARKELRESKALSRALENQVSLYEANVPWLKSLLDYSLDDINKGLAIAVKEQSAVKSEDADRIHLSEAEWASLSRIDRSQLALNRYFETRHKNAWLAGVAYERYVGAWYEEEGFSVIYNGAISGKEDQGIDLICTRDSIVVLVQCKRLSPTKEIPVRENVVAQIYGASLFYAHKNAIDITCTIPTICTNYKLSDTAKEFASALNVHVVEGESFKKYAAIKCNNKGSEKIYHLPFDQQYDKIHINKSLGDCYVSTVKEAESLGFRRAYKWSGT